MAASDLQESLSLMYETDEVAPAAASVQPSRAMMSTLPLNSFEFSFKNQHFRFGEGKIGPKPILKNRLWA